MRRSRDWIELAGVLAISLAWLLYLLGSSRSSLAGDPYAVYYPITRNLLNGEGWAAFAPLQLGPGRQPGYPILLAVFGLFTDDLFVAGAALSLVASLFTIAIICGVLWRERAPATVRLSTVVMLLSGATFIRAAFESLPDMTFTAAFGACAYLLIVRPRGSDSRSAWVSALAGCIAGASTLIRPNGAPLLVGGTLAIALSQKTHRARDAAAFAVGFLVIFGGVMLGIRIGLAEHGFEFPPTNMRKIMFVPSSGQSEFAAFMTPVIDGLDRLPWRLKQVVGGFAALVGSVVVLAAALWKRNRTAIIVVCLSSAVLSILIPLHFEHRYYLFLVPTLFAASMFGALYLANLTSAPAWLRIFGALVITVSVAIYLGRKALPDRASQQKTDRQFREICDEALATLGPGRRVVGIEPVRYDYSRFLECQSTMREASRLTLVPSPSNAAGLDAWIGPNHGQRGGWLAIGGLHWVRTQTSTLAPSASSTILTQDWSADAPGEVPAICRSETFEVPPGRYLATLRLDADQGLAARVELTADDTHFIFGVDAREVRLPISVRAGVVEVQLCPADPIRAPGTVRLQSLTLAPIPD